ncbi:hypothetical protein AAFF_G00163580 [Aldrovandia affinis]|uniref:Uncharacterized protein n=1 Tax=Aldrovandia affinis TaxID=143900 RepID=A0AAD7SZJ6_9TELE|nr:hypothetical protein AAFF_G00163580 [Aldrovandia affinis]
MVLGSGLGSKLAARDQTSSHATADASATAPPSREKSPSENGNKRPRGITIIKKERRAGGTRVGAGCDARQKAAVKSGASAASFARVGERERHSRASERNRVQTDPKYPATFTWSKHGAGMGTLQAGLLRRLTEGEEKGRRRALPAEVAGLRPRSEGVCAAASPR